MSSTENSTDYIPFDAEDLEEEQQSDTDRYIAVSIILVVGVCGLIADTSAIRVVWKSKNLHNCFGYLLLLHASAEAIVLCCFVFWAVPITLFNRSLSKSILGIKVGQLVNIFYYTTLYVQLSKAINRFCAIFSPLVYRRWFSNENVKFIILAVMICSLMNGSLYFFPGCNFYFDGDYFTWTYDETPCYEMMAFYTDLLMGCSIVSITILIDISTLCLIIRSKVLKGRNNKDVRFFIQAFATSILYTIMLIISQALYTLSDNKWYVFGTVTFTWEMCHTIDGILMIFFNLRKQKTPPVTIEAISKIDAHTRLFTRVG
ncbi:hypothetical protein FO519_005041 [Halicephalobus sp. NKZ332]|nr:hypothetical protein FO519_005041 [Halicephalobus sp. NKZ332]